MSVTEWIEHPINIYQVTRTTKNCRKFRQVAREACGECMEPDDGDIILFGEVLGVKDPIVCVACGKTASDTCDFNKDDFYNWINFLFVKKDYQDHGYGTQMVEAIENSLKKKKSRPVRVQSAYKAVPFFTKMRYKEIGDAIECVNSGSPLFRVLQTMEKS